MQAGAAGCGFSDNRMLHIRRKALSTQNQLHLGGFGANAKSVSTRLYATPLRRL